MLYTIALILAVLMFLSVLNSHVAENEVHSLLAVGILGALIRGTQTSGAVL
jgi:hypothetical protein